MSSKVLLSLFICFPFTILSAPADTRSASCLHPRLVTPAPKKELPFFWGKLINTVLPSLPSSLSFCPVPCPRSSLLGACSRLPCPSLGRRGLSPCFLGAQPVSVMVVVGLWFVLTYQTSPLAGILQNFPSSAGCGVTLLVLSFPLPLPRGMGRMGAIGVLKAVDKVPLYNQRGLPTLCTAAVAQPCSGLGQ